VDTLPGERLYQSTRYGGSAVSSIIVSKTMRALTLTCLDDDDDDDEKKKKTIELGAEQVSQSSLLTNLCSFQMAHGTGDGDGDVNIGDIPVPFTVGQIRLLTNADEQYLTLFLLYDYFGYPAWRVDLVVRALARQPAPFPPGIGDNGTLRALLLPHIPYARLDEFVQFYDTDDHVPIYDRYLHERYALPLGYIGHTFPLPSMDFMAHSSGCIRTFLPI